MGKLITRLRPGDTALQDQIFTEARRLYEAGTPLAEAVSHLIEMAGDNPNAFGGFTRKNTKGLAKSEEGQAIMRLVGTASAERVASHRMGVPLTWGKHSPEERSLAAMPVADAFLLLSKQLPSLLDAEASARQLAVDHREDQDGGTALQKAVGELVAQIIGTIRSTGNKSKKSGSLLATNTALMVVMEHLSTAAGVNIGGYKTSGHSWWPESGQETH